MSPIKSSALFQVLVVGKSTDTGDSSLDEIKRRLSKTIVDRKAIFGLSADRPTAIKESVSLEIAEQFVKTLKIIGVDCWLEPMPAEEDKTILPQKTNSAV